MAKQSLWDQYLKLLERLRFGRDSIKKWDRLRDNAYGLAGRLGQCYERDITDYPAVERTQFRDPC